MKYLKMAGFVILLLSFYLLLNLLSTIFLSFCLAFSLGFDVVIAKPMLLLEEIDSYLLHIGIISNLFFLLFSLLFFRYFMPGVSPEESRASSFFGFKKISNSLAIQALLLGVSCYLIISGGLFFTGLAELFYEHQHMLERLFDHHILLVFLGIGVIPVFTEEIIYRGIILKRLRKDLPFTAALFIQAIFFGMMHFNLLQGGYAFLLGLIFGTVYFLTGSLWVPVIAHFGFNVSSIIMVKVFDIEPATLNMGVFMAVGLVVFAVASGFLIENYKKPPPLAGDFADPKTGVKQVCSVSRWAIIVFLISTAAVLLSIRAIQRVWSPSPEILVSNYKTRGITFHEKGKHDRAVTAFSRAIELDTGNALVYLWRGYVYKEKGKFDLAIADYTKAMELGFEIAQGYHQAYHNRGHAYERKEEFDLAIADYSKAIELNPVFAESYAQRGSVYMRKGDLDLALADCDRAIDLSPELAFAYSVRGYVYAKRGEFDYAVADCTKAIELDPESAQAYWWRGAVYLEEKEFGLAIADYTKAIELDYEDAVLYSHRGYAYAEEEEFDLALADFVSAIKLDPKFANPYRHRGHVYEQTGEKEKAFHEYEKAIELNPEYAQAYRGRGNIYSWRGEVEKALLDYERFIELDPDDEHAESVLEKIEKLQSRMPSSEDVLL